VRFIAKYAAQDCQLRYRTVWADSINEANHIATRWTPRGFMLVSLATR
jgi:hypothetical protein